MRTELAATFRTALHSAFPAISVEPVVVATNQARHGDYQCNNAMQLFGRMKGKVRCSCHRAAPMPFCEQHQHAAPALLPRDCSHGLLLLVRRQTSF